ncbi:hypothetical protein RhiLY_08317 [Ceratobasidium sp. AG-Ba]|nr:hypothetical protein RhiLY_08317 [Ceratobasidium sp. AG-Ba]
MSEVPIEQYVFLRYLPEVPEEIPPVGGMYATMPEESGEPVKLRPHGIANPESQKWRFVRNDDGDGYKIEGVYEPVKGLPPVGLGPAWKNDAPGPGTPITISLFKDASAYDVNVVKEHELGLIISIVPKYNSVRPGSSEYVGASGDNVEIVSVPFYLPPPPHPGWLMLNAN